MRNIFYRFVHRQLTSGPLSKPIGQLLGDTIRHRAFIIQVPPDTNARIKVSLRLGLYETAEVGLIRKHLRRDLDCIELGASIGVTGCHIRSLLAPGSRLLSIEAMPDLSEIARANLRRNHAAGNWEIINAAVWYGDGPARMQIGFEHTRGALAVSSGSGGRSIEVPAIRLSQICARLKDGLFNLVADIEGAEFDMVEHDSAALANCRTAVLEIHGSRARQQSLVAQLSDLGLKVEENNANVWVFHRRNARP